MSFAEKCLVCNKTRLCIGAVVIVIILIVGLAVGLSIKKYQAEKNLKYATKRFQLPNHYFARRPKGIDIYKDMLYLSPGSKGEIGHARKCVSCITKWTVYMLNNNDEIAVVIERKPFSFTLKYDIEEQWKGNATSYKIEYSWGGSGFTKEKFIIKNANDVEIASTERFRMEFDKTIKLKDSSGSDLGTVERPAFQLYPTWEITVKNEDVVPAYLFGAIATITTLREAEDNDKK